MALRGTLPPKQVKFPGMLVDLIVVDPANPRPSLPRTIRPMPVKSRCRSATSQR